MRSCNATLVGLNSVKVGGNQFSLSVSPDDYGGLQPSKSYRNPEGVVAEAGKLGLDPTEVARVAGRLQPNELHVWHSLEISEADLRYFGWSESFR